MLSSKWESYFRVVLVLLLVAQWPSCSSKLSCLPSPSSYGGGSSAEATSCSGWGWTGGGRGKKRKTLPTTIHAKRVGVVFHHYAFSTEFDGDGGSISSIEAISSSSVYTVLVGPGALLLIVLPWQDFDKLLPYYHLHAYTYIHDYPGPANHLHVLTRPDNDKVWWQLMIDLNDYYSILSGARDDDVHRGGGRQWL